MNTKSKYSVVLEQKGNMELKDRLVRTYMNSLNKLRHIFNQFEF